MSNSFAIHGFIACQAPCPWNFPGKNTGVGCHFLLQGIFPDQRLNLTLLHWQADSLPLSHQGSPGPYCSRFQTTLETQETVQVNLQRLGKKNTKWEETEDSARSVYHQMLQNWVALAGSQSRTQRTTPFSGKGQWEETAVAAAVRTTVNKHHSPQRVSHSRTLLSRSLGYYLRKQSVYINRKNKERYKLGQMGNVSSLETTECLQITKTHPSCRSHTTILERKSPKCQHHTVSLQFIQLHHGLTFQGDL